MKIPPAKRQNCFVNGAIAARATSFKPLNLSYRLSSGELNLADIRAAAAGQKKPEVVKNLTSEGTVLVKDGTLSYRGNVGSPEGTIADGDYRGLRASTSFVNHVANIDSLTVSAFGGSLTGKGNYDMRQSTPRFAATANVKSMDLTQIFRALRPSAPQNIRGARQYGPRSHRSGQGLEQYSKCSQRKRQSGSG